MVGFIFDSVNHENAGFVRQKLPSDTTGQISAKITDVISLTGYAFVDRVTFDTTTAPYNFHQSHNGTAKVQSVAN